MEKKQIDGLLKKEWYIQGFNATPNLLFVAPGTITPMQKVLGYGYEGFIFDYKNDYGEMRYGSKDMERIALHVIAMCKKDKNYLKDIIKKYEKVIKKLRAKDPRSLEGVSVKDLIEQYHSYVEIFYEAMAYSHISDAFSLHMDTKIKEKVLKYSKKVDDFTLLMSPISKSWVNEQEEDLYKIKDADNKKELLEKHSQKYFWILNNYVECPVLDAKYFSKALDELQFKPQNFDEIRVKKQKLIEDLGLDDELKLLITLTEEFSAFQDDRKKHILITDYYIELYLEAIGKVYGISLELMNYLIPSEITLENMENVTVKDLKERVRGVIQFSKGGENSLFTGKDYERYVKILQKDHSEEKELMGMSANTGFATGKVRVCKSLKDLKDFKQGEVLVTAMTRPEFVPAMKKASAIVTDEGGVTSHAAILSRELGVPCIIGTSKATSVLKNGDFVEVNANHGRVQVLK